MNTQISQKLTQRCIFATLFLLIAIHGQATQPLTDHFTDGTSTGLITPSGCCNLPLPPSKRLQELRREEIQTCSALGGPVGMFKLDEGKLWLTALYKCSGEVPLQDVYPGMETPTQAAWLSGSFHTTLFVHCQGLAPEPVYVKKQQTLVVVKGVVQSITEGPGESAGCGE